MQTLAGGYNYFKYHLGCDDGRRPNRRRGLAVTNIGKNMAGQSLVVYSCRLSVLIARTTAAAMEVWAEHSSA
jgi:hypothetical protein